MCVFIFLLRIEAAESFIDFALLSRCHGQVLGELYRAPQVRTLKNILETPATAARTMLPMVLRNDLNKSVDLRHSVDLGGAVITVWWGHGPVGPLHGAEGWSMLILRSVNVLGVLDHSLPAQPPEVVTFYGQDARFWSSLSVCRDYATALSTFGVKNDWPNL